MTYLIDSLLLSRRRTAFCVREATSALVGRLKSGVGVVECVLACKSIVDVLTIKVKVIFGEGVLQCLMK